MQANANTKVAKWSFDEGRLDEAIVALSMSVQFALQKAMTEGGLTHKVLAERLGVSPARVSQYFSKDASNLTLKTIAKIAHALGEEFELMSLKDLNTMRQDSLKRASANTFCTLVHIDTYRHRARWEDWSAANERSVSSDAIDNRSIAVG